MLLRVFLDLKKTAVAFILPGSVGGSHTPHVPRTHCGGASAAADLLAMGGAVAGLLEGGAE